jgi:hypothetical protein
MRFAEQKLKKMLFWAADEPPPSILDEKSEAARTSYLPQNGSSNFVSKKLSSPLADSPIARKTFFDGSASQIQDDSPVYHNDAHISNNQIQIFSQRAQAQDAKKRIENLAKADVSIAEMLDVVKQLWFKLDGGRDMIEMELRLVARMLVDFEVIQDESSAIKYIWRIIDAKKNWVDWDDFNSLFATGIFKSAIIRKAKQIKE